ncbi:MAG: hypothetical protein ACK5QC_01435 [Bacteroidota bacterium]|nr:hypothetical protein [Bacteroidota bacterium]MCA6443671.1 hypothetical protein [Bacteroidota bacterium]
MKIKFSLLFLLLIFFGCSPVRMVKPLQKRQQIVGSSFGGPLINFAGAPIPIPFTSLFYANGITNNVTVIGGLNTTSLLFGNIHLDASSCINLFYKENKYGISLNPGVQSIYHIRDSKSFGLWPTLDLNGYFHFKNKSSFLYTGVNSWIELKNQKAHGEKVTAPVLPSFQIGYQLVNTKWNHQFEIKYLGIGRSNQPNVVDYIGGAGQGAFGLFYGLHFKF